MLPRSNQHQQLIGESYNYKKTRIKSTKTNEGQIIHLARKERTGVCEGQAQEATAATVGLGEGETAGGVYGVEGHFRVFVLSAMGYKLTLYSAWSIRVGKDGCL